MTGAPDGDARRRLVALAVLGVVSTLLVVVALLTGGSDSPKAGLRIERGTVAGSGDQDLVVYVDDREANVAARAGGRPNVELQCLDRAGRPVSTATYPWPFAQTDDGLAGPHVHQRVTRGQADRIVSCRLNGTKGLLEGRVAAAR